MEMSGGQDISRDRRRHRSQPISARIRVEVRLFSIPADETTERAQRLRGLLLKGALRNVPMHDSSVSHPQPFAPVAPTHSLNQAKRIASPFKHR